MRARARVCVEQKKGDVLFDYLTLLYYSSFKPYRIDLFLCRPSSLGWLVDFIEKSTTISGTRGFMSRSSLLDANQQSLLIMSTPMPLCFKSRETCSHQMEAVKEIVVSTPPDIMKKVLELSDVP